jgi:adenosylcobinamide kinase/adenosylcobinamide-phosphate guanylyltransferase
LVIVSNEVGLGTIGMDSLTRRFCDELGWLNQALAQSCDRVIMSVAGLPLNLKG